MGRRLALVAAAWLLPALLSMPAAAAPAGADSGADFRLDIDAGGHTARIADLAFAPDGETVVSASDDKTIRIWDWRSGVTLRVVRGYMGEGGDGKVYAVAVSPDGNTIAAGGHFGPGLGDKPPYGDLRLFDFATGRLGAVLKGAEYDIYDIAFSPDGKTLAAGGGDGRIYLWRRDGSAAAGWAQDRALDADSWHVDKLAFAAGGTRLVAATTDNGIRLWDLRGGEEIALPADAEPLRDTPVMALAVSQDGARFAVGSSDGQVQIRRADDGALERALPRQDFLVGSLTFAAQGTRLVVSCGYRCADRHRSVVWDVQAGAPVLTYAGHDGTVFASAANADGSLVATAGGTRHAIQLWDPMTGERKADLEGKGRPVTAVGIDAAGGVVAWGNDNPCPDRVACPDRLGALTGKLVLPDAGRFFDSPLPVDPAEKYLRAEAASGAWSLTARPGGEDGLENAVLEIGNGGKVEHRIENDAGNGYAHSAFTLIQDGRGLITGGTDGTLLEYRTATGEVSGEFIGHAGEIHAMAAAGKAGLLVTGSADQTLRLWNLATRKLIVSMVFAGPDWIVWTPQGYYYSSPDGDRLIGWQVNQGRDHEGRYVRSDQLKRYLWSPEIVRRAIVLHSAEAAIGELRPGGDRELQELLKHRPPDFQARLAADQAGVRDGFVAVEITGAKEAGADVAGFSILSNSRNVGAFTTRSAGGGDTTVVEVPVEDGENTIRIIGTNDLDYLTERSVTVLAHAREKAAARGKLYVAVVGVDKYPFLAGACGGRTCDLRYPVDDATGFLKVVAEKTAPLFSSMESLVLVNRDAAGRGDFAPAGAGEALEPEADTIDDQLADFLDRPGEDDTTIVFVAGHGINIDDDYYFIPTDGRKQGADRWKRSSLVRWSNIQQSVEHAKGMRFMLLDTCHAANAFNPRLEKDAADARIVVFSATAANSTAAELPELGHGVFTYSVLEGLRGKAGTSGGGVTLFGLADYISKEVTRLTRSQQKPFYYVGGVENVVLAEP